MEARCGVQEAPTLELRRAPRARTDLGGTGQDWAQAKSVTLGTIYLGIHTRYTLQMVLYP